MNFLCDPSAARTSPIIYPTISITATPGGPDLNEPDKIAEAKSNISRHAALHFIVRGEPNKF